MHANGEALPYPLPDQAVAFFNEEPVEYEQFSIENGRPVYGSVIVVTIKARGQKNSEASYELMRVDPQGNKKIRDNALKRPGVREAFEAWQQKQVLATTGTPLETWPVVTRVQVATLKHVNVFTVEQLAELPDSALPNTGLGLTARETRAKAQAYLTQAAGSAGIAKLAARIAKLEDADKAKDKRIAELEEENAQLRAGAEVEDDVEAPPPARARPGGAPRPGANAKKTKAPPRGRPAPKPAFRAPALKQPNDDDIAGDVQDAIAEDEAGPDDEDFC